MGPGRGKARSEHKTTDEKKLGEQHGEYRWQESIQPYDAK